MLPRSFELVVTILAILKCGAVCLPLNTLYTNERIDMIISDSKAPMVVTTKELSVKFSQIQNIIEIDSKKSIWTQENEQNLDINGNLEDLFYVIYTSGK